MEDTALNIQRETHVEQIPRPSGGYAFLNHSPETLPNNLPPNIDDKLFARHKRRRTSPEDQAILETAYSRDPKPDKAARIELVKQVALGEKEVQIWFQNRRQTSRRKSRPLLPHEIVQYQLSRSESSFYPTHSEWNSGAGYDDPAHASPQLLNATSQNDHKNPTSSPEYEVVPVTSMRKPGETSFSIPAASQVSTNSASSWHVSSQSTGSSSQISAATKRMVNPHQPVGYLANRRSAPSLRTDPFIDATTPASHQSRQSVSEYRLKKSSSFVRLSLSNEGKASIITKDGSSPSPPRAPPFLQVSTESTNYSQQPTSGSKASHDVPPFKPMQRSTSGRSRDSRAWEFWCDKDARSELEDKAEKDASGSAADAIDLLRSTSGRKILGALPTKRNTFMSRQQSSSKRARLAGNPSLLQRSSTSLGRLQSKPFDNMNPLSKPSPKLKHSESAISVYIPGNDSDKENWSPQSVELPSDNLSSGRTPSDHSIPRHVAFPGGHDRGPLIARAMDGSLSNDENNDPEKDPELTAFMRGGGKSNKISEEDELDCVQNLISLSQGNWR